MDETKGLEELRRDNQRLCAALRDITKKMDEISEILNSISDLTTVREPEKKTPVTDEDVKSLLKKYSRLS